MRIVSPFHTQRIFGGHLHQTAIRVAAKLEEIRREYPFDFLAGCGFSAAPLLGALNIMTQIPFTLVRKFDNETSHDSSLANGTISGRYVIVDDLISSGFTVTRIVDCLREQHRRTDSLQDYNGGKIYHDLGPPPEPVAALLYSSYGCNFWAQYEPDKIIPVFDADVDNLRVSTLSPAVLKRSERGTI